MIDGKRPIALLCFMKVILYMFSISLGILLIGACSTESDPAPPMEPKEQTEPSPTLELNTTATVPRELVSEAPDFVYPDGPVTIYYDDGSKHSSGLYKDGKKEGNWVYFGTEPEVVIRQEVYEGGVKISEESFE